MKAEHIGISPFYPFFQLRFGHPLRSNFLDASAQKPCKPAPESLCSALNL
jgi:hypothetical protein